MARAEETSDQLCAAYPVRGGDGPSSYAVNSVYQVSFFSSYNVQASDLLG